MTAGAFACLGQEGVEHRIPPFGGRCQWVLDTARQAVEWLGQPLGFESLTLRRHSTLISCLTLVATGLLLNLAGGV
jgi:hypothetical protein